MSKKLFLLGLFFLSGCSSFGAFEAVVRYTPPNQEIERTEETKIKAVPQSSKTLVEEAQ